MLDNFCLIATPYKDYNQSRLSPENVLASMTTAHRPTWKAAISRADEGGYGSVSTQRATKNQPSHTTIKRRHDVAADQRPAVLASSLLALEKEEQSRREKVRHHILSEESIKEDQRHSRKLLLQQTNDVDTEDIANRYDDENVEGNVDSNAESDLSASSSDEDSDNDEEALMRELQKVRAEREESNNVAMAASSVNPLLSQDKPAPGKRRWNEDVVFRRQAKNEPSPKKRFINDTVRNDFHVRFLNKFIR